jgi:hypothetical protein
MFVRRAQARRLAAVTMFAICVLPMTAGAAGNVLGSCTNTSDKPQSKIWYNDGSYWAVLQNGTGSHIYRLVGGNWEIREDVDSHRDNGLEGHEDVLWNGYELFVLVYASTPLLYKFVYDTSTDLHHRVAGFPVAIPDAGGSETMVIDQDSTGRLWAVYEGGGRVYAAYSTSADHTLWETPGVVLRDGLNDDDVASVIAFNGRIGVFWSDQNRWEFGFRTHADDAAPDVWTSTEIVRPGVGNSDDHLNLCADSAGRVYAITKDVENEFAVHKRSATGSWTTRSNITGGQTGTRPSLMLDATETKLYAMYTCWDCGGSDPIVYRVGSTSTLSFGSSTTLLSATDQSLNDVTDMKQTLPPDGFMAIAAGGGRSYWNGWGTPPAGNGFGDTGEPPPPPPPPTPMPPSAPITLAAGQAVRYKPPGIATCWGFDEPGGDLVDSALDSADKGTLGAAGTDTAQPVRVSGIEGGALRFDGANDYVEIAPSPLLDIAGSFTLEAWVRRSGSDSPDVVIAKENSTLRNYRLRITTANVLELSWETASASSRTTLGTRTLTDGLWHHVAAVHDQARGEDRLYVDGALDARRAVTGTPAPVATTPLLIGARRTTSLKEPFGGDIDLVRIAYEPLYDAPFTPPAHYDFGSGEPYVMLTWAAAATGGTPTGYWVSRSDNAEDYVLVTPAALAVPQYIDNLAVDGVLRYTVRATNDVGTSLESSPVEIVFGAGPRLPQLTGEPGLHVQRRRTPTPGHAIWALDEGTGSTSADATAAAHVVALGNSSIGDGAEPAWIAGVAGSALRFDGGNDYGRVEDAPDLRFPGSFTVETWVRIPAAGTYGVLVSKESSSTGRNYRLAVTTTGKIELQWKNLSATTQSVSSDITLVPGTWFHVAGVFDAAAGENRVYIDGRLRGRKPAVGTPEQTDVAVRIGARLASSSLRDYFAGDLDLLRLTGAALYHGDFQPEFAGYGPRIETTHLLTWDEAVPGSARIVGYTVQRSIDGGAWLPVVAAPVAERTLSVAAGGGTRTCYRVAAVDRLNLASAPIEDCTGGRPAPELPVVAKAAAPSGPRVMASPNPFNPATTITLRLDAAVDVDARVYDVRGRCLRTLARGVMGTGEHRLVWDGRDATSAVCAAGVYFVHVRSGDRTDRLKLVLAK